MSGTPDPSMLGGLDPDRVMHALRQLKEWGITDVHTQTKEFMSAYQSYGGQWDGSATFVVLTEAEGMRKAADELESDLQTGSAMYHAEVEQLEKLRILAGQWAGDVG